MRVHLIGPGGAGKTTAGQELALLLEWDFHDLDQYFLKVVGDISKFINDHGYEAYAARNIETYIELLASIEYHCVIALSSGFMVYPVDVHPDYRKLKKNLAGDGNTFLLLPSVFLESCVDETVRRQLGRSYLTGGAEAEEKKIRKRFSEYSALPCKRIETSSPPLLVAHKIVQIMSSAGFLGEFSKNRKAKPGL